MPGGYFLSNGTSSFADSAKDFHVLNTSQFGLQLMRSIAYAIL
jgi:hypothetical protein